MKRHFLYFGAIFFLFFAYPLAACGAPVAAQSESIMIDSSDPGIKLHLASKKPKGINSFTGNKIILFIHGSTSPGSCWDIDLPGGSWMDNAVSQGFCTYAMDIRGYGGSTRPDTMKQPSDQNPPYARTVDAVKDVAAAVDWIRKKHGVEKINLVAWSWGTVLAAKFTSENNGKVERLAMYAPVYLSDTPGNDVNVHYFSVKKEGSAKARLRGIPEGRAEEISPMAWFDVVWAKNLASDKEGMAMDPPVMRAPSGSSKDSFEYWRQGKALYDAAAITLPSVIVVGEWDQVTPVAVSLKLFDDLKNAPHRRLEILPEATHIAIHEKNRMMLINEVQRFLQEEPYK